MYSRASTTVDQSDRKEVQRFRAASKMEAINETMN